MLKRLLLIYLLFSATTILGYKNLVLIAAPGSGKGTLSQYLCEKYNYFQICPGDLFRVEILAQTEFGRLIQPIVEQGQQVDDAIICQLVAQYLATALSQQRPFIIDGFPRTPGSLAFLTNFLQAHDLAKRVCFVQLLAPDDLCWQRIITRQVCNHCFRVYNCQTATAQNLTHCDRCHTLLTQRTSDTEQIAKLRLQYFHAEMEPLFVQLTGYDKQQIDSTQSLTTLYEIYDQLISR